jgi:CheY-like chemotaxis protein
VRDLRSYARASDDDAPELVELPALIEQALRIVGSELSALAHIEREYQQGLPRVLIPRARIVQVLTNLLINAMHAMRDVSRPLHRLRVSLRADSEAVAISIADTGTGIAPDMLDHIFDPFFTTKGDGRGSGLGLSISRSIMLRIGGDLLVESIHGTGATFIMFIPLPTPEALRTTTRTVHAPRLRDAAHKPCLLLVEDDQRLLRLYARLLGEHFEVILAADGQEAIELLTSGTQVDIVVSDLTMPEVDGAELYRWIRGARPGLCERMVFVTGADDVRSQHFLASVPNLSLPKPVSSEKLIATLLRVL